MSCVFTHCRATLYIIGGLCVLWNTDPVAAQEAAPPPIHVLFLGNSLTSGYGLAAQEAYPAVLQTYVDSLGWPVTMINAGVSGDTSAGGLRRLKRHFVSPPDILVVSLGGNDGLRGLAPSLTKANLTRIIQEAQSANPDISILIAGIRLPPNLGVRFQEEFQSVFSSVTDETGTELIPFLLEGVGGVPELNQPDGIHPNAAGQRILSDTVWKFLAPVLRKRMTQP